MCVSGSSTGVSRSRKSFSRRVWRLIQDRLLSRMAGKISSNSSPVSSRRKALCLRSSRYLLTLSIRSVIFIPPSQVPSLTLRRLLILVSAFIYRFLIFSSNPVSLLHCLLLDCLPDLIRLCADGLYLLLRMHLQSPNPLFRFPGIIAIPRADLYSDQLVRLSAANLGMTG